MEADKTNKTAGATNIKKEAPSKKIDYTKLLIKVGLHLLEGAAYAGGMLLVNKIAKAASNVSGFESGDNVIPFKKVN